jgi:predicted ATPase
MFLEAFRRRRGAKVDDAFPWTVPALRGLRELRFTSPVTFLMGENGCGKSTLLEAIAVATEADAMLHDDNASPFRRGLGAHITRSSRDVLVRKYGADPHARSHGETFLGILRAQLLPRGLYLLDEPETPLSPTRVLTLLTILLEAVANGSQFVIATHSPILAAYPGATVYVVAGDTLVETPYDDLEHVRVTRDFLNAPARYLRHLTMPEGGDQS